MREVEGEWETGKVLRCADGCGGISTPADAIMFEILDCSASWLPQILHARTAVRYHSHAFTPKVYQGIIDILGQAQLCLPGTDLDGVLGTLWIEEGYQRPWQRIF